MSAPRLAAMAPKPTSPRAEARAAASGRGQRPASARQLTGRGTFPGARLKWALAAVLALGPWGCAPPPKDSKVAAKLLRGDADPLQDPGTALRSADSVGSLEVTWVSGTDPLTQVISLSSSKTVEVRFATAATAQARLVVRGLRASDSGIYSAGRSVSFHVGPEATATPTVLLGPVEAFTPVGPQVPGPRLNVAAAALGDTGALVVGGREDSSTAKLASPGLLVYRLAEGRLCGAAEGCLSGEQPAPRRDAIAVALTDGSVLHGLGRLESGAADNALFLTQADGSTASLTLAGDALPALYGAQAVQVSAGVVLVFGGHDGTAPSSAVYRVDVSALTVTALPQGLITHRAFPGVALLSTGQVLVAGGEDASGPLATAEVYTPGTGSLMVDGGSFPLARKLMRGARVSPQLAHLADDSVVIHGGGLANGEVFQLALGNRVGGFIDLAAPPPEAQMISPALVRLKSGDLLMVGGEAAGSPAPMAALFSAEPNQVPGTDSPVYTGVYRGVGAASTLRGQATLVELADGSVLVAGGGVNGDTAQPTDPNPGAPRVEIFTPAPLD